MIVSVLDVQDFDVVKHFFTIYALFMKVFDKYKLIALEDIDCMHTL